MVYTFVISKLNNLIHSLKYVWSATLGCKDIGIKKSEIVAKKYFI